MQHCRFSYFTLFFYFQAVNSFSILSFQSLVQFIIMVESLGDLPNEIHLSVAEYLTARELINVAHVSIKLRQIYGAISWKTCLLTSSGREPHYSPVEMNRFVPYKAFFRPERYAWFVPGCVLRIIATNYGSLLKNFPPQEKTKPSKKKKSSTVSQPKPVEETNIEKKSWWTGCFEKYPNLKYFKLPGGSCSIDQFADSEIYEAFEKAVARNPDFGIDGTLSSSKFNLCVHKLAFCTHINITSSNSFGVFSHSSDQLIFFPNLKLISFEFNKYFEYIVDSMLEFCTHRKLEFVKANIVAKRTSYGTIYLPRVVKKLSTLVELNGPDTEFVSRLDVKYTSTQYMGSLYAPSDADALRVSATSMCFNVSIPLSNILEQM